MHISKLLFAALCGLAFLVGCDAQRISELQPGTSTEADVRDRFGLPENTWNEPGGGQTLEYNRQPAGTENFMIELDASGRLVAVRQVLTPANFAKVEPGMGMDVVRRLLGKPASTKRFDRQGEMHISWHYLPQPGSPMVFTVVTRGDGKVLRTETVDGERPGENTGGGR